MKNSSFTSNFKHLITSIIVVIFCLNMSVIHSQVELEKHDALKQEALRFWYANSSKPSHKFSRNISLTGDCMQYANGYLFFSWYKGGMTTRNLMLSRLNIATNKWTTIQFSDKSSLYTGGEYKGGGNSHRTAAVGVSKIDGTVHLVYDMHADNLKYRFSEKGIAFAPDSEFTADKFSAKRNYLRPGEPITSFTYPNIAVTNEGELILEYRKGTSRQGDKFLIKYDGNQWSKATRVMQGDNQNPEFNQYGGFRYFFDRLYMGSAVRVKGDAIEFNKGFYFADAGKNGIDQDWKDINGNQHKLPIKGLNAMNKLRIAQPLPKGNNGMTSAPSFVVSKNGAVHFTNRIPGQGTVHYYSKPGSSKMIKASGSSPGVSFPADDGRIYSIGLVGSKIRLQSTKEGEHNWRTDYNWGRKEQFDLMAFEYHQGKIYIVASEKKESDKLPLHYIVLNIKNIGPGNPTPPTPTPSVGPDGYTFAVNEGGTVNVSGTVNIAYGANGKFEFLKNVSANTPCNNTTFGDPTPGVKKACYIQKVATATIDGGTVASNTNQTAITTTTGDGVADLVKFKNTSTASASYRYLITDEDGNILTTETSSHDFEGASVGICKVYGISYQGNLSVSGKNVKSSGLATGAFDVSSNAIVVTRKAKTTTPPSGGPDGYTYATDEGGTVNVSGTVNIAYGADGKFNFLKNVSANTPCNNATFGDPIFKVKKSCYIQQVSTTNPNPTPPTSGNCSFGTPTSSRLASLDRANYTNIFVLGDGPNLSNIRRFRISWNGGSKKLTQFAFNTANGKPSYYVDLRGKIEQKFGGSNPSVKISGSGIGVDGDYWVTKRGNDFVMASKDGKFSIYCSATSSKPSCTGQKAVLQENAITVYPNPAQETLNISGLTAENTVVTISDLLGKVVHTISLAKDQNSLDIRQLKTGMYFLSFTLDNGTIFQKTIVRE